MSRIKELVNTVDVVALTVGLAKAVSVAKAVNSTQEYKHKDKVDKALTGAATAIDVGSTLYKVFKR